MFGIVLAYYFQTTQLLRISAYLLTALLLIAASINLFYKKLKAWRFKTSLAFLYYWIFAIAGIFTCLFNSDQLNSDYFADKNFNQLKVWISNEPQINGDIARFEANVTKGYLYGKTETCSGTLLIALKFDSLHPLHLKYGDEFLITAKYLPVEPPYNPNEFNFKQWLASKNIYHQTFIRQSQLIKIAENRGNPIKAFALRLRQQQVNVYRKLIKNDEAFAVASTLILGYRADLSKETLSAYSKTGKIHALSVSGMHVGIIYIALNFLLGFLDRRKATLLIKVALICVLIWGYSLLTGFSPSVLRSAIMLTVFILSKQFNRSSNSYNVVAFTAFCLLVYQPFLIWDVGFQLSFMAVIGLIYYQPKIKKWLYFKNKWANKLWETTAMGLAAQLATLPLSIYYFHQFPVYFIISNLFVLIPITLMMYLGIAILLLRLHFLAPIFEYLINFTNRGLKRIADLPYAGITEIWINRWELILLAFFLLLLSIGLSNYKRKLILLSLVVLVVFQGCVAYRKINFMHQEELIFFSLRKNYAAAFINGNQCVLITDLTAKDRNFEFFVKPALDEMEIKKTIFVTWRQDFRNDQLIKSDHQILYRGKSILLLDENFNNKRLASPAKFDWIWVHNNPKYKLDDLAKEIKPSGVLIDASNKDYMISQLSKRAILLNLSAYSLKKQQALHLKL